MQGLIDVDLERFVEEGKKRVEADGFRKAVERKEKESVAKSWKSPAFDF